MGEESPEAVYGVFKDGDSQLFGEIILTAAEFARYEAARKDAGWLTVGELSSLFWGHEGLRELREDTMIRDQSIELTKLLKPTTEVRWMAFRVFCGDSMQLGTLKISEAENENLRSLYHEPLYPTGKLTLGELVAALPGNPDAHKLAQRIQLRKHNVVLRSDEPERKAPPESNEPYDSYRMRLTAVAWDQYDVTVLTLTAEEYARYEKFLAARQRSDRSKPVDLNVQTIYALFAYREGMLAVYARHRLWSTWSCRLEAVPPHYVANTTTHPAEMKGQE